MEEQAQISVLKCIPSGDTKSGAGLSVVTSESGSSVTVSERKTKISGMYQRELCKNLP